MIFKINKIGDRYFFARNGKEWEIMKMFDKLTKEGINSIKIEIAHGDELIP
ncbi:hypothetical protein LCGC14_0728900 [marine sediment metagenome]|uniref:Uncharacterized protein n=1 Tax=marine sediment metagenome TaxID=412755 RepID=A0A0F9THD9_9ZZZZ